MRIRPIRPMGAAMKLGAMALALVAVGAIGRLSAPDPPDPLPACQSEDSPSCLWTDPDTGISYVHGYDADMSIEDRTGIPWCLDPAQTNCLDIRVEK